MQLKGFNFDDEGKIAACTEEGGVRGSDLGCQVFNLLPSVVQHVPHTEDGAEGALLWMVVTAPNLFPCHLGGKVPSKRETFRCVIRNKLYTRFICCIHESTMFPAVSMPERVHAADLVTLKSGKRILFLMKIVKLFTSSMGLLGKTRGKGG